MRAWAIVGAGATAAVLTAALFGACSSRPRVSSGGPTVGTTQLDVGPQVANADSGREGGLSLVAGHGGGPDAPDGGAATELSALRALQQCSTPRTAIVNHPDGGVVFNNAMTSADAGFIDRTQGVIDAIGAQSDKIRCCLDAWTAAHAGTEGRLLLRIELDPDGQVRSAEVDAQRSTIADGKAVPCVVDVVRQASYPSSPTGSVTIVEYPIVATARRL